MIKIILKKLLKRVDVNIRLHGDDLTVTISYGGVAIWADTFDLLKDGVSKM